MSGPAIRVGVLLAGCGTHDGTEVGEAILTFLELERKGAVALPLAPAGPQMHVVDHSRGEEVSDATRDMASEAARLTRGRIALLEEISPDRLHALVVPGGSGTAKNLMHGFLERGADRRPIPAVRALLAHCLEARKPIGLMSVANFLLPGLVDSPVLPERAGTNSDPLVVDPEHRLVYAPCFLTAPSLAVVAESVAGLVDLVLHYATSAKQDAGLPA
ncbi:MAG: isoprenoid biosynthesis protein ElbB [Acidobacteriota bacterium]